jgi:cytochrome P450
VDPIRSELLSEQYAAFEKSGVGLPLLDSFIKESARLTPVESSMCAQIHSQQRTDTYLVSTRRHALQPFTLSDGTRVNVGDWACTPVRAMMQAPEHYPSPLDFNGFRFAQRELAKQNADLDAFTVRQPKPSKLTDVGGSFHVWGTGRMAW